MSVHSGWEDIIFCNQYNAGPSSSIPEFQPVLRHFPFIISVPFLVILVHLAFSVVLDIVQRILVGSNWGFCLTDLKVMSWYPFWISCLFGCIICIIACHCHFCYASKVKRKDNDCPPISNLCTFDYWRHKLISWVVSREVQQSERYQNPNFKPCILQPSGQK